MEPLRRPSVESAANLKGPERPVLDIVFIITGVIIFALLAAYVAALRRI